MPVRLELDFHASRGRIQAVLREGPALLEITMQGIGTDAGLEAFLDFLDRADASLAPGETVRVQADISALTRAPLRTPLSLGRWLLAHRHRLGQGTVVVGSATLRAISEAVFHIAGLQSVQIVSG